MELVEGGELFDHIVQMGSFTEPVARYAAGNSRVCHPNPSKSHSNPLKSIIVGAGPQAVPRSSSRSRRA